MLGKLFKYEFKNTAKIFLTIYGVLIFTSVLTIIASVAAPENSNSILVSLITSGIYIFYYITIIACYLIGYIYLVLRFFKTMFSSQGYLTHTLPVKPLQTFHVKLFTSTVWLILLMMLLSVSMIFFANSFTNGELFATFSQTDLSLVNHVLEQNMGFSIVGLVLFLFVTILLSCLSTILMAYMCCCIGQLFNSNKVAWSIVSGVILYFIQQVIAMIAILIFFLIEGEGSLAGDASLEMFDGILLGSMLFSIAITAIYYVVCNVIVRKRINLD